MKSKKVTYPLGLVVIIVWGLIIYRIFIAVKGSDDDQLQVSSNNGVKELFYDYTVPKDTIHLILNYRDPFGIIIVKDTVKMATAGSRSLLVKSNKTLDWSFIKYSGYIRNPQTKKLIAILTINGKETMMTEGEIIDRVRLIKNMRDYVMVSFDGNTKNIPMNSRTL